MIFFINSQRKLTVKQFL